jgi:hypothetical protein
MIRGEFIEQAVLAAIRSGKSGEQAAVVAHAAWVAKEKMKYDMQSEDKIVSRPSVSWTVDQENTRRIVLIPGTALCLEVAGTKGRYDAMILEVGSAKPMVVKNLFVDHLDEAMKQAELWAMGLFEAVVLSLMSRRL